MSSNKKTNIRKGKTEKVDKTSENILKVVGSIILVVLIFSYVANTCSRNSENSPNTESYVDDLSGHEVHAFITSEKFVKNELLSPTSAEFGNYTESKVLYDGNSKYKISNFVDCDNAYGTKIRHQFYVILNFKGGMWEDIQNWEVINLTIK